MLLWAMKNNKSKELQRGTKKCAELELAFIGKVFDSQMEFLFVFLIDKKKFKVR
jgi:hypothetical protein